MRVMIKFAIPIYAGNEKNRTGKLQKVFQQLAEDLEPEAGYFFPEGGERAGFFVVDMRESSQVAEIAERFFYGMNARVEMTPVMNADDVGCEPGHGGRRCAFAALHSYHGYRRGSPGLATTCSRTSRIKRV